MAKTYKVKNLTNRTLELVFGETSERVEPRTTSRAFTEAEWKGSFAEQQAETFVARREVKVIESNNGPEPTPVVNNTNTTNESDGNNQNSNNKKKGDK